MKIFALALWTGVIMASFPALAQTQRVLTIEADEWCPINCDPANPQPGIGIELAKKIFEPLGYRVDYTIVPWEQALADVRSGKVDAVVGANKHDDSSLVFPETPIYMITDDFYVLPGSAWRYQGNYTLKNQRVGIIKDYGYGDIVTQFINENKNSLLVITTSGKDALAENLAKLQAGGITVLIESKPVMDYTLRKLGKEDSVVWAGSAPQDNVYLAFSPRRPGAHALADQYDASIRSLQDSGMLKSMYAAYGLQHP